MANISQIKLPNGDTHNFIDTASGYTKNVGTVTSVAASGSGGITISGSPITSSGTITIGLNLSTAINGLGEGASPATINDYAVVQYAGGGTTTTTYHRRKLSNLIVGRAIADENGYNINDSYISLGKNTTALANGTDLNTITSPGNYRAPNATIAKSLTNCPINTWFIMRVGYSDGAGDNWEYQEIIQGNNGARYYRHHGGGTWTSWQSYLSTSNYLPLTGGSVTGPTTFGDTVSIDDLNAGQLVVSGSASFANTINGNIATASALKDSNNGNSITACYSTGGVTDPSYYCAWDGYKITYISKANLKSAINTNTTYSAGTGLSLSSTTFSVKLGYTTSGNNRAVQADSSGNLYVVQKDDNTTALTSMTGTLGVGHGGTGNTTQTANKLIYAESATKISSISNIAYFTGNSTASTPATYYRLHLHGATYGNTAANMISNTEGLFSFGDGGPQITFDSGATPGAGQAGALIYTDNDTAGTGVSWHFVSNQTDWNVTSKRFHARTGISIGTNLPNTSYNLYVNGTTYFNGNVNGGPYHKITTSTSAPSGGSNGDIWFVYA